MIVNNVEGYNSISFDRTRWRS